MSENNTLDEYQNALIKVLYTRGYDRITIIDQINHVMEDVRDSYITQSPENVASLYDEFGSPESILTEYGYDGKGTSIWKGKSLWLKTYLIQLLPLFLLGDIVYNLVYTFQLHHLRLAQAKIMELWFSNAVILYVLLAVIIQRYTFQKYGSWDLISQSLPPVSQYQKNYRIVKWVPLLMYAVILVIVTTLGVFQDGSTVLILSSLQQLVGIGFVVWFIVYSPADWSQQYLLLFFWLYLLPEVYRYDHMILNFPISGFLVSVLLYVFFPLLYVANRLYRMYRSQQRYNWQAILRYGSAFAGFFFIDSLASSLGLWNPFQYNLDHYRIAMPFAAVFIFVVIFVLIVIGFQYMNPLSLKLHKSFDHRRLLLLIFVSILLFQPLATSSHFNTLYANSEDVSFNGSFHTEFPASGQLHMYMMWPEPAYVNWSITNQNQLVKYEIINNSTISRDTKEIRQIHLLIDVVKDELYYLNFDVNITDSNYYQFEIYFYLISSIYLLSNWTGVYAFVVLFAATQFRLEVKSKNDK